MPIPDVKVVPVGTGQALELGRRGDTDVVLTHTPPTEEKFMAEVSRACHAASQTSFDSSGQV